MNLVVGTMAVAGLWGVGMQDVKGEVVEYRHGDVVLEGYVAYNPAVAGKRPAVLIVHEWEGHGPYARRRADMVAKLGYLGFAIDMYGKGVRAKNHEEAGKLAGAFFGDRKLMRERAAAALEWIRKHEVCDPARVAAMGYCFGGTTVLELARGGYDIALAASFHGVLATPAPAKSGKVKAGVVVFHGADDSFISEADVTKFQEEMSKAGADWTFVSFGGAVHAFTVAEKRDRAAGTAYDEKADRRSWEMVKDFLAEAFR